MGGTIALNLAPTVESVALVVAAPVINGELSFSLHLLLTSPMARRMFSWMRKQAFFSMLGDMKLVATPGLFRDPVRRRNHQDLRATTVNAAVGSLRAVVSSNLEAHLTLLRAPTLIVVGERDTTVSAQQGWRAAQLIPGSKLVSWPESGHHLIDDRGDEFDALVLQHLDGANIRSKIGLERVQP